MEERPEERLENPGQPNDGPSLLTIDLAAVAANWRRLRDRVAPAAACAAVVKADAYGLGVARVAPVLAAAGCRQFFVATLEEALALRPLVPNAGVAMLGGITGLGAGGARALIDHHVVPVLNHLGEIEHWQAQAHLAGRRLPALIHLDTGMNRLGLGPSERATLIEQPERLDGLAIRAWLSHLACAEDPRQGLTPAQLGRFRLALGRLPAAPASLANSAGIFRGRAFHGQLVRPGCALYGVNPTPAAANPMAGVIRLAARILQVREVTPGMTVGYGATWRASRESRIATLGFGYADGYLRSLSGAGTVLIGGQPAPVIGRVSMDLVTVDVTGCPDAQAGGWAEVIGPHRTVDQAAAEAGTIGYEILTALGRRYRRRYVTPAPDDGGNGVTTWAF